MSEHQWREQAIRAFKAERDAVMRNPTFDAATAYWHKCGFPPPVDPTVPQATMHKARLQWLDATDAMLRESIDWLLTRGYEPSTKGAPPLTPERRDADRRALGKPPLEQA